MSMSKLQNITDLPLRRILDFLDINAKKNLLDATENTVLGIRIKNMARKRKYVCPECIIMSGTRNLTELWEDRERDNKQFFREINAFNFFSTFRMSNGGNENYKYEAVCVTDTDEVLYNLKRRFQNINDYESVWYFGSDGFAWSTNNWINVIQKLRERLPEYEDTCNFEQEKIKRIFFGGEFQNVIVKSRLQVYTRKEFEQHICNDHNVDGDLTLQEFWVWVDEWASNKPFNIPRNWYASHNVNIDLLDEIVLKKTIAHYYKLMIYKMKNMTNRKMAECLGSEKEYMLHEVKVVFELACRSFEKIYFPEFKSSRSCKSLMKYYDMIYQTLDAMLD